MTICLVLASALVFVVGTAAVFLAMVSSEMDREAMRDELNPTRDEGEKK